MHSKATALCALAIVSMGFLSGACTTSYAAEPGPSPTPAFEDASVRRHGGAHVPSVHKIHHIKKSHHPHTTVHSHNHTAPLPRHAHHSGNDGPKMKKLDPSYGVGNDGPKMRKLDPSFGQPDSLGKRLDPSYGR